MEIHFFKSAKTSAGHYDDGGQVDQWYDHGS